MLDGPTNATEVPHAIVFGPDGGVRFRGSAFEAEPYLRRAVGESLMARVGRELEASVKPSADALLNGTRPEEVLPDLLRLASGRDRAAGQAQSIADAILAGPGRLADEAERLSEADPWPAYLLVESIGSGYAKSPLGRRLGNFSVSLRTNKVVKAELFARPYFEAVREAEAALSARPQAFDPSRVAFREANAEAIDELKKRLAAMKKLHGATRTFAEAEKLAAPYFN